MTHNYLAIIQGGEGPDVWDAEFPINAVDFKDASNQALARADELGGVVTTLDHYADTQFMDMPLKAEVVDGALKIRIGAETIKCCYNDPRSAHEKDGWLITDAAGFCEDVVRELNSEREDGSSILTDLLDLAVENAQNNGSQHMQECKHEANKRGDYCKLCGSFLDL